MNIEALKQQLAEGKLTKEQFAEELKKLLDAGSITQEDHDAELKASNEPGGGSGSGGGMTAEEIKKLIQSETDKVRTEYNKKLKAEQEEKERLLKEKMSEEEKAKFEKEKYERELKEREDAIAIREVELHTIDKLTTAKLPLSFKAFLVGKTKEDADKNIEAFSSAWQAALKEAVDQRFKDNGSDPPGGKGGNGGPTQKKWKEMNLTERGKLIQTDIELARKLCREAGENPRF